MAKTPTDIRSLARAHTSTAVKTLAHIMMHPDAPAAARVAAAQVLLDRGWGKAPQTIDMTVRRAGEMTDDELADIARGCSEGVAETEIDTPLTH